MDYLRCVGHVSRKVFANRYIVTPYRQTWHSHQSGSYSKSQHSWIVLSSHHLVFLKPVSTQVHLFVSVGNTSSCLQYQVQVSAGKIIGKFLLRIPTLCKWIIVLKCFNPWLWHCRILIEVNCTYIEYSGKINHCPPRHSQSQSNQDTLLKTFNDYIPLSLYLSWLSWSTYHCTINRPYTVLWSN